MRSVERLRRLFTLVWLYTLELVIAVVAIAVFARLALEVAEGELHPLNVRVLQALYDHRSPGLDALAVGLSRLGDPLGTTVVGAIGVLVLSFHRRYLDAAASVATLLGGAVLAVALKQVFQHPRPDLIVPIAPETGYGFPSAHALMAACLYGQFAALLVIDEPRRVWRWACAAVLLLLAISIGWSRLYLGVHWLSDVVAGGLVAVFWVASCLWGRRVGGLILARRQ
jgi:membrane-associated phospholipid phosphatase